MIPHHYPSIFAFLLFLKRLNIFGISFGKTVSKLDNNYVFFFSSVQNLIFR